jgi:integrase
MPAQSKGSVVRLKNSWAIRWPENGRVPQQGGFATKTEARQWFDEHVAPRLRRPGPSADITLDAFCGLFLDRWTPGKAPRTVASMVERLGPARDRFGSWRLAELEHAVGDVAAWRQALPTEHARYRHTRALRQVLNAAVRWRYLQRNPAADIGPNHQPRPRELEPFTVPEVDMIADEMTVQDGALVVFAAETGLRTQEWAALERRDIDRLRRLVIVRDGKTDRHAVPLTPRAEQALDRLPPRIDTPLVFPAPEGGRIDIDNWRLRRWYPALEAAGLAKRGPYALRHTFATEALAAGVSTFDLAEMMGNSLQMIDAHYGHLAKGRLDHLRELMANRSSVLLPSQDVPQEGENA